MQGMDGSGALGNLGIITFPIGTMAELEAQGIDPKEVASCHACTPGVVRGCALWSDCIFNQKKYGGFKGVAGPKYVGYLLVTHEGSKKEDFMACHMFLSTLLGRMFAGNAAREQGKPHEIVRIIAQEGEKVFTRIEKRVDMNDKSPNPAWEYVKAMVEVPRHPRPGENDRISYDQELVAREMERRAAEQEIEDRIVAEARRSIGETPEHEPSDENRTVLVGSKATREKWAKPER